jgi:hypothetical protein
MKKTLLIITSILMAGSSFGQRVYDTHEFTDMKWVMYTDYSGKFTADTLNPMRTGVDTSLMVGKYVRSDTMSFNFFKMRPSPSDSTWDFRGYHGPDPVTGQGPVATKKIKMKVFSTDPAATIELNVGIMMPDSNGVDSTVMSVHSQYRGFTTLRNQWEDVEFTFVYYQNKVLADTLINKIVVVFNPGIVTVDSLVNDSTARRVDTLYFDDFAGPEFYRRPAPINSIATLEKNGYELKQNMPNPSNGLTRFEYALKNPATVNLSIYNILGTKVEELVNQRMGAGRHNVEYDTSRLTKGMYYYTIKVGEHSQTRKMIVN